MKYSQKLIKDMPTFTPQTSLKDDSTKYYSVIDGVKYRNSAVLVPLVEKSNGTEIILTIRSNDLPSHAGQISFPGGKVDAEDKNPVDTAYREAFEEIGLSEKHIKRLGYLDITTTGTNYMILPVVGLIDIDFLPKINRFIIKFTSVFFQFFYKIGQKKVLLSRHPLSIFLILDL